MIPVTIRKNFLISLGTGSCVALILLFILPGYTNPRIEPVEVIHDDGTIEESFFLTSPDDGVAVAHSGKLPLAIAPPGVSLLSEAAIERGFVLIVNIRNARNEIVGFAVELEVHPEGDMLSEDLVWETEWLLVIPGRGILILNQQEHSGELGRKVFQSIRDTGKDWVGDWTVQTTVGPLAGGRGVIVGGTGEFSGAEGSFIELDHLTRYSTDNVMYGDFELRIIRNARQ